jgi:hypothetical protein
VKLTELQTEIVAQYVATWVSQQMRNREMTQRRHGRFILSNGMPVILTAEYHHPEHLRPRYLTSPDAN